MRTKTVEAGAPWLEIDILGLRRTLERKGKAWAIFELVQNSWDTDATRVDVTLTKPNKHGMSTLTCCDNAPDGYRDLSEAHTLFGSSGKKTDPTKRGRFNAGEKFVLVMCESAKVTSTTGQILFQSNGTRRDTNVRTEAGTEFQGVLEMTEEEWLEVGRQVQRLFPPITTTYNGVEIPTRQPLRSFENILPTEVANDRGVLTLRKRKTEVRVYEPLPGEAPTIYERGIPVVEMDGKYHVSVEQKIPLNTERDNVTPSYLKHIHLMVVNEMHQYLTSEDVAKPWVQTALEQTGKISWEATKKVVTTLFGEGAVAFDPTSPGSNREAAAANAPVVLRGALSRGAWKSVKEADALPPAREVFPVDMPDKEPRRVVDPSEYNEDQRQFARLIEELSPTLIGHAVKVKIIEDNDVLFRGCSRWNETIDDKGISRFREGSYVFEINLAFHDCSNWEGNFYLMIHEMAHHAVQRNDHLLKTFYITVNQLGAKLMKLALERPEFFSVTQKKKLRLAA